MTLEKFLPERKSAILEKWFDQILDTYPADTSAFLKKQKNRFANPVGHTIYEGIEKILDSLMQGADPEEVPPFLDNIIRVRAVQDFTPSQAISFIFSLKKIIRGELESDKSVTVPYNELLDLESRIDALAMVSFDIFVKCREKLYDIKANELRNMTFRLVQKANESGGERDAGSSPKGSINDNAKKNEVTK